MLIIHAHHQEDHVDRVRGCVFHGQEVRCKGKIVANATTYEVVKKIIIQGPTTKTATWLSCPQATMTRNSSSPIGGGGVLLPRWHVCVFPNMPHDSRARTCKCSYTVLIRKSAQGRSEARCAQAPLNGVNTICTNECRPGQTQR